jgi:hypothetical protein
MSQSKKLQQIVKQLPVPLLPILWGAYTWKYMCYRWRENASVFLNVKLHLSLKSSSLLPIHQLQSRIDRYILQAQTRQILEFYAKLWFIQPTFKGSTPCSTWLWTTSHLKYYSYHVHYPNLTCFSSLKSWLQGATSYQILSSPSKPVTSYHTKPERVLRRQKVQLGCRPPVTWNVILNTYVIQIWLVLTC